MWPNGLRLAVINSSSTQFEVELILVKIKPHECLVPAGRLCALASGSHGGHQRCLMVFVLRVGAGCKIVAEYRKISLGTGSN